MRLLLGPLARFLFGVPTPLVLLDLSTRLLLGLTYDELTSKFIQDFGTETIFEDGRPASVDDYPVSRALRTGAAQPATTLGIRRPDGGTLWAVFRAVPTRDPERPFSARYSTTTSACPVAMADVASPTR